MEQLSLNKAVEYLQANPDEIKGAWRSPQYHIAGALFTFVRPEGKDTSYETGIGCLTMIKSGDYRAWHSDELTDAIRADDRIPASRVLVTPSNLPVLAEWQRRIEKFYRNLHTRKEE